MKKLRIPFLIFFLLLNLTSINYVTAYNGYGYGLDMLSATIFGACCIIYIFFFIIWIILGVWVYKDAEKRGKSGAVWLIIVLIFGIIGVIFWLLVRPPLPEPKVIKEYPDRMCPNCGRTIPFDARICPFCKKDFEK